MADPVQKLIRKAMIARLKADAGVGALIADRIYDQVPVNPQFPYSTIVCTQTLDQTNSCSVIKRPIIQVNAFSRKNYLPDEAEAIAGAIEAAIQSAIITVSGHTISQQNVEDSRTLYDPDGQTVNCLTVFQFETNPTS